MTKQEEGGGGYGRQCVENKERLTLRIHRGRSGQKPPAALTSVLLAKHGCPPGLGPALAGLAGRDIVTHIKSTTSAAVTGGDVENRRLDLPQITVTAAAASTILTDCDLPKRRTGSTLSTPTNAPAAAVVVRSEGERVKRFTSLQSPFHGDASVQLRTNQRQ